MRSRNFAFCIILMLFFVSSETLAAKTVEFRMANFFPSGSGQSIILSQFGKELENLTAGRIKITYYHGGSLLSGAAMFDGLVSGVADIGYSHIFYTPGIMPVIEAVALPLGYPNGWVGSHVINDFYDKFKPQEFNDVHILWFHSGGSFSIFTKQPVSKAEDLKGLVIRHVGRSAKVIKALGGSPAPTAMVEVYEAITKGVLDGVVLAPEGLQSWRLAEVIKYVTFAWQMGDCYPFFVAMNKKSYNKIPTELKPIFDCLVGVYRERVSLAWNGFDLSGANFGLKHGVKFITLPPEDVENWRQATKPIIEEYVKEMVDKKGYSETEVRLWIEFALERKKYWTDKQKEWGVRSVSGPEGVRSENLLQ
ncbi:MAG: TRAP transporter substrate-binding protein [Deltaproteobacteria bacterium]|nr:TRAP transporter substrate-binding protein [Deltaproteobacteria bacterium]